MYLRKVKKRASRIVEPAEFVPNYAGQGGNDYITLKTLDGYLRIELESKEEVHQLLSQAHIVFSNWKETR